METKTSAVKTHAKYSASGSKRWLTCQGSTQMCEGMPNEESDFAKEGTTAHECLEVLLNNRARPGKTLEFLRKKYPSEMVIHAETTLYEVLDIAADMPDCEFLIEARADLPVSEPDQYGTSDISLIEEFGKLAIIDYKYGAGIAVSPEENSQLIYYALGIAHKYDYNFAEVELVIIQPRASINGKFVRKWKTDVATLLEWREKFEAGIKASKKKNAPLTAGDHCQFCPAKIKCPELGKNSLKKAQLDFDDESGALTVPKVSFTLPNIEKILPALDRIEDYIGAVREHAFMLLKNGHKIRGYKLVEKRSTRKWTDIHKAEQEARTLLGIDIYEPADFKSPAQIEIALKAKLKRGKKDQASKWIAKRTSQISTGVTMTTEDDKRPAVNPADDFEMEGVEHAVVDDDCGF